MKRVVFKKFKGSNSNYFLYRKGYAYEFDQNGQFMSRWSHYDDTEDMISHLKEEGITVTPIKSIPKILLKSLPQIISQYE